MEIYLVRHGQSEANAGLTKNLDSDVTPLGRRQAEVTAQRLTTEGITRIFVSPLRRTLQTVMPICDALHMRATAFPVVCEYFSPKYPDYLTFPGLTTEAIMAAFPSVDVEPAFPCELRWWPTEFENYRIAYERAEKARHILIDRFGSTSEKILIVSHADPIGWLLEAFMHTHDDQGGPPWSENCSINHLSLGTDGTAPATAIVLNDTAHLAPLGSHAA